MAEHGSREHRTGTSRHTLQPLAAKTETPSRPIPPTSRTSCKSLRPVDMPSRRDELLAVDTARMRSCQRWNQGVGQKSADEAGAEMGAVAVCSARCGRLLCGMVWGDGGGSAGHAGVGQERLTTKLRITLLPGKVISRSSTSSALSQVLFVKDDQVNVGQPQSTLRTRREQVSEGRKHSHSAGVAAGSELSFQEQFGSSHA